MTRLTSQSTIRKHPRCPPPFPSPSPQILGASIQYYEGQFRALVADGEAQAALRQQPFDLTLVDALNVCGMYLAGGPCASITDAAL